MLVLSFKASATHIVGGEITYKLLNPISHQYQINLSLFVDCQNGSPQAIETDKEVYIGVFDAQTRSLKRTLIVNTNANNRVNAVNYSCVRPPTGVCVDQYLYTTVQTIDPGNNGVILAFQRCCRNNTISNIVSPEATGATFWVKIPPSNIDNSSAVFKNLPPNYVCVNAPLTVDHSATDSDGDSLIYELHQPYQGATSNNPRPTPPGGPNYLPIQWASGFSTNNQVTGSPQMIIDRWTGELTVTPTQIGQYVIGITVKEYRKGTLIGQTYRDYQINVIKCQFDILADFTTSNATTEDGTFVFECGDTIFFKNRSQKADIYEWNFGDPTTTDDTSSEENPWYIYPGNGDYTVTLKVTNEVCEDVYKFKVKIRSTRPFTLGEDIIFCEAIDHIIDTRAGDATKVEWDNGLSGRRIRVFDTGTYVATVHYGMCVYKDTVRLDAYPIYMDLEEDSLFCDEVDILLDAGVDDVRYQWSTGLNDTNRTVQVNTPGVVKLLVRNEFCVEEDSIRLWLPTDIKIEDAFYCGDFVHTVDLGDNEESVYTWSNGGTDAINSFSVGGDHWVRINTRHCVYRDTFNIRNENPEVDLGPDLHFCDVIDVDLDAGSITPTLDVFEWSIDQSTQVVKITEAGKYWVTATDIYGCVASDTIDISVSTSPQPYIGEDTTICLRSPVEIGPESDPFITKYEWSTGETSRTIEVEHEQYYTLKVTDKYGCEGKDSLFITVDPTALPNEIFIPNAFTPNGDHLNDYFPYSEVILQPEFYIVVYSRWGEKVFDSRESSTQNWDGYYKGKKVPNETFIFYAEYFSCDGVRKSIKGTVNPLY